MTYKHTRQGFMQQNMNVVYCPPCGESTLKGDKGVVNKATLMNNPPSALRATSPAGGEVNNNGFTLIELLVVVLIIGILAAVAVPQYQKAVWKSRFTQVKLLAKAIHDAEEIYYLANGSYTFDFSKLDLQLPSNNCENSNSKCTFPGGYCELATNTNSSSIECYLYKNQELYMGYTWFFKNSAILQTWSVGKERYCLTFTNNPKETSYQVCQSETNSEPMWTNPAGSDSGWAYPFN